MTTNMTTAEREKMEQIEAQLKEASYLLSQAIICLRETELEYAPLWTSDEIQSLPQARRLRWNVNFMKNVRKFQIAIEQ
jgi:uncharacterized protein YerC